MLSIFDQGPPEPCPTPFNFAAYVLAAGRQVPDKIALEVLGLTRTERWSYARLEAAAPGHVDEVRRQFVDRLSTDEIEFLAEVLPRLARPPDD